MCDINKKGLMLRPKKYINYYHVHLGLPDKSRTIKGLVILSANVEMYPNYTMR